MEKRGVIQRGTTPDVERRLKEKRGTAGTDAKRLDDDVTKRLADAAAQKQKKD